MEIWLVGIVALQLVFLGDVDDYLRDLLACLPVSAVAYAALTLDLLVVAPGSAVEVFPHQFG
mgnify:CR=1 FL=1